MARLREHDLIHTSQWAFDGMNVVPKDNRPWSLSDHTQEALAKIEKILQAGFGNGAVEVCVEEVYNGERLRYD